jgi:hypothetical protein
VWDLYFSGSLKTVATGFAKYKLYLLEVQEFRRDIEAVNVVVNYVFGEVQTNQ